MMMLLFLFLAVKLVVVTQIQEILVLMPILTPMAGGVTQVLEELAFMGMRAERKYSFLTSSVQTKATQLLVAILQD